LEGETPLEPPMEGSPPSPTSSSSTPWPRGSIPPLYYGFVAVSWSIYLILVPYELPNMIMVIYVILMWWIFILWYCAMRFVSTLCKMY
jgi:hypothetical protein